ncbi:hypothetical protein MJ749_13395 [Paenibacillus polymyxa]|uniref:hypothetical protein n=1 Tax=Paenibacillus polymyxa TaxID=1406 RepID=UPI001F0EEAB2|nr:hypothetical protein [Paenibacillus polymyxa]UMR33695.1 hypothetical protein MJ749_13395 [Paenibacillus polymyxa]
MSERTYKLLDGFILTEKNGRLYLHEGSNTPVPVPAPHTLIGDLLALVDSLQQQVKELQEGNRSAVESREIAVRKARETCVTSNMHYAKVVELLEQLAERDRTIDLLTKQITDEAAISAKAIANLRDIRALVTAGWYNTAQKRLDEALGE